MWDNLKGGYIGLYYFIVYRRNDKIKSNVVYRNRKRKHMRIQGISGSRGVAVGNVYRYIQEEIVIPDYTVAEDQGRREIGKFAAAMASTP